MVFLGATRAVALQSAKMRVPSIKFRKGGPSAAGHGSANVASPQRATGSPAQTVVLQELPAKFRRLPLSEEEIEYINRGGPA